MNNYHGSRSRPTKKLLGFINFKNYMLLKTKSKLNSCFLLLIFLLRGFFCSWLNNPSSMSSLRFEEFSLRCLVISFFLIRKISQNDHLLPLIVIRCMTRCYSFWHDVSLIIHLLFYKPVKASHTFEFQISKFRKFHTFVFKRNTFWWQKIDLEKRRSKE